MPPCFPCNALLEIQPTESRRENSVVERNKTTFILGGVGEPHTGYGRKTHSSSYCSTSICMVNSLGHSCSIRIFKSTESKL